MFRSKIENRSKFLADVDALHTQTESSGTRTPTVYDCFPNGRATFWTKCTTKTTRFWLSTENPKKSRFELFPKWK